MKSLYSAFTSFNHPTPPMQAQVELKILDQRAAVPQYATPGSAAVDLYPMIDRAVHLAPGEQQVIGTGLAVHINNPKLALHLLPRSGLGSKGLVLGNTVGLIDSDYQGELKVVALNRTNRTITIEPGKAFAQACFIRVTQPVFQVVAEFSAVTERGTGGFGSTDKPAAIPSTL